MDKTLELVFYNEAGGKKVISISNPREDVTAAEAQEAMAAIIEADVFETSGGRLVEAVEARVRETQVTVLA